MRIRNLNLIRQRESENDGQSIYLYYDDALRQYVGYGLSAYYSTSILDPLAAYSEEAEMPMVFLKEAEVDKLRNRLHLEEHQQQCFYHFRLSSKIGRNWYQRWVDNVKH